MLYQRKHITLIASVIALTGGAMIPSVASAGDEQREWWEKSNCQGFEGATWIECQKAISQNKRDRKRGVEPTGGADWMLKTRCQGLEGVSWIECQKAISQNKRDRKQGIETDRPEWWEQSHCLGLEGLSWSECQKALKQKKRERK